MKNASQVQTPPAVLWRTRSMIGPIADGEHVNYHWVSDIHQRMRYLYVCRNRCSRQCLDNRCRVEAVCRTRPIRINRATNNSAYQIQKTVPVRRAYHERHVVEYVLLSFQIVRGVGVQQVDRSVFNSRALRYLKVDDEVIAWRTRCWRLFLLCFFTVRTLFRLNRVNI